MSLPRWYAVAGPAYLATLLAVDTQVGLHGQLVLGGATWLLTTFDPDGAADVRIGLRLGDDRFVAEVTGGRLHVAREAAGRANAEIVTDAATLRSVVFGDRPLADAVAAGDAEVRGDAQAAGRFVSRFPRPAPVGSGGSGKPHSGPAKP